MSEEAKYPRGVSARPPGHVRPLTLLERVTLGHVGLMAVFATWAFGGNTDWARTVLSWWGSFGVLITLSALLEPDSREGGRLRPLRWLWPLALFNVLVLAGALNPNYREVTDGVNTFYYEMFAPNHAGPSAARPDLALESLWFFDAAYLSCFNLALIVRQRRALRALLLALVANAVVLAMFGTVQKLMGAKGLYFGYKLTKQSRFFASFIYQNHWGAFVVIMTAVALGLVFHFLRRSASRDFWHSPAFGGLVALALLAATVPLSGSRSCTIIVILLAGAGLVHGLIRLLRNRRRHGESAAVPVGGALLAVALTAWFAYDLGRDVITVRMGNTREQIAGMRDRGESIPREVLYRDTWNLAAKKIWFGWGWGSYPTTFFHRNTQYDPKRDNRPHYYHDAHSDWLQSVAEVGLVGTVLHLLCGAVPLWYRRRALTDSVLVNYLLAGCATVLLYAALEFPFGNRAVVLYFWLCFFCAIHYGRIETSGESAA